MGFRQRAAMIFRGIAGAIRKEPSLTALCLFVLLNIWLVGVHLPGKGIILLLSLAALLLFLFWRDDWRWLDRFRRSWLCFSLHSLEENAHTLATWALLAFFLSVLIVNAGWISTGRHLLVGFVALGMLSALLLLIALMRNENQTLKKAGYILGAAVPVIYAITSSYAASDFYMMSGIKLDDSPVLNLWVKVLYFSVWFSLLIYPAASITFLVVMKGSRPRMMLTLTTFFFIIVLSMQGLVQWFGKIMVETMDYAINREWQSSYYCAGEAWRSDHERYFAIDDENWALYYSGRDGSWGFERLHCTAGSDGQPDAQRRPMEGPHPVPQWFKDVR
ncbi:hypothetical protein V8O11_19765 [Erwinia aphidicola]|uniref:hypothetical protein n=1 Tax=Erwinia aphidicola TaxID=68334 RepID=UPI00300C23CB